MNRSQSLNVPWAGAKLFETRIRRNIKLAECPSHGQSIFAYAPGCPGAHDYQALAREVMGVETGGALNGHSTNGVLETTAS
jgi:chromosome partitioning protein